MMAKRQEDLANGSSQRVSFLNNSVLVALLYLFCNYLLGIFLHIPPGDSICFPLRWTSCFLKPHVFLFVGLRLHFGGTH